MDAQNITILDLDHPGARDPKYRLRRDFIATESLRFWQKKNSSLPVIAYLPEEDETWATVNSMLDLLHPERACTQYLRARKKIPFSKKKIPTMKLLDTELRQKTGFGLRPAAGLVDTRTFLTSFADGSMMCTQYVRHASRPTFTPEPDLIHEFIGHVPMFANPEFVSFCRLLGHGARMANDEQLVMLERLFWFTVEYGLIEEKGQPKAFGAGLLAGIEDMNNAFKSGTDIRDFDLQEVITTTYDYSKMQDKYFIIPSFEVLCRVTEKLIRSFQDGLVVETLPTAITV